MIRFENISKQYGQQKAVDNLTFFVPEGQVVGFLGPNGAGKSTSMKILTGFLAPSSGTAQVAGLDVARQPQELKQLVGYLPENNPLYLDMYVQEYLLYVAKTYGIRQRPMAAVARSIDQVGLGAEQHKRIGQLSKGYRQRVGLAQAIVHEPKVLVLDEPTSGLDPNQLVEIRELIVRMGREKTVLLSSHILQEVEAICQRVLILKNGSLVADGATSDLQKKSEISFSVDIEFENDFDPELFPKWDDLLALRRTAERRWELDLRTDLRAQLFRWAAQNGHALLTLHLRERSLEQLFRDLTK